MRRRLAGVAAAFGLVLATLALTVAPGAAQLSEGEIQIVDIDSSSYPEIAVTVDVPSGFAGSTLTSQHFTLTEGGAQREIEVDKLEETTAVVLAVDTSGSMRGEALANARAAAQSFLAGLPDANPVAVVGFGDEVLVASPLTTDRFVAAGALETLASAGETALHDALVSAADLLGDASTDRVALVVLSDGADTASTASAARAAQALAEVDAAVYSIGLETGEGRLTELESLTLAAGGTFVATSDTAGLTEVYDGLASRLANEYRILFGATSSGPVDVQVVAALDGRLAVARLTTTLDADLGAVGDDATVGDDAEAVDQAAFDAVPEELAFTAPPAGMLQAGWVLWAGVGALFFSMSVVAHSTFAMANPRGRRQVEAAAVRKDQRQRSGTGDWLSSLVDRLFLNGGRRGAINAALDRAGLNWRPGEFIVLVAAISFGVGVIGWLIHPFVGLGAAAIVAGSARSAVAFLGARRRRRFADQLDNTLLVLASSLRAGHGVQRALSAVADEAESPTAEEFARVVAETRIGRDLVEALQGVAVRLGNEDFEWVVRAVAINRELGGNLAEVLDNVAQTIRERNQLRRQVSALSAEGRLSAGILYVLPFVVGVVVRITNPNYLSELTESTVGVGAMVLALVLMVGGGVWIRKIVKVRY